MDESSTSQMKKLTLDENSHKPDLVALITGIEAKLLQTKSGKWKGMFTVQYLPLKEKMNSAYKSRDSVSVHKSSQINRLLLGSHSLSHKFQSDIYLARAGLNEN